MKYIIEDNKIAFDTCYELNQYTQEHKLNIPVEVNDVKQLIAASLLIRIHNGFQSVVILSQSGLETEAKIISRTILESLFVLRAISIDDENVDLFIKTDKAKREKWIKNMIKHKETVYLDLKSSINEQEYQDLKEEIKQEGIKDVDVHEWAEKADLKVYYAYGYKVLNSEVHTDIRTLQKYLEIENDEIIGLDCLPRTMDIRRTLFTACSVMIIALDSIFTIFSIEKSEELNRFNEEVILFRE
ncbi:DUF5677 domain-containing protein [Paenibacillus chibensis]|uniref:DUF5677 domain-containing protein n=1 Tax=Paenibacillus chibensis TaxID=59846 RepID=A0ABU6PQ24_9BACL|nr:DUF5677 domain-containing protein [Paenibacillus chibensis]